MVTTGNRTKTQQTERYRATQQILRDAVQKANGQASLGTVIRVLAELAWDYTKTLLSLTYRRIRYR